MKKPAHRSRLAGVSADAGVCLTASRLPETCRDDDGEKHALRKYCTYRCILLQFLWI